MAFLGMALPQNLRVPLHTDNADDKHGFVIMTPFIQDGIPARQLSDLQLWHLSHAITPSEGTRQAVVLFPHKGVFDFEFKWLTDGSPRNEPLGSDKRSRAASCKYTRYIDESRVTQQALVDNFNALKQVVQSQITSQEDDWTGREQHHPFHPFSFHPCPSKSTRQNQGHGATTHLAECSRKSHLLLRRQINQAGESQQGAAKSSVEPQGRPISGLKELHISRKDIRAWPVKLLHIGEVVKGYAADSHRSKTNLFNDGQQVPLLEYDQDYLKNSVLQLKRCQRNQGYFLCLVRGQDCKIWKRAEQWQTLCVLVGNRIVKKLQNLKNLWDCDPQIALKGGACKGATAITTCCCEVTTRSTKVGYLMYLGNSNGFPVDCTKYDVQCTFYKMRLRD
ncbi:hypothetical protein FFLO_07069 [Filobasidium floriforme]|uniref:Uncharacterized protein n=1 Tax=Filobasidium floriforme TaxID=5210 RepID=A0A8K0NPV9_9TREE|nr:uncharacterized protein HD553DRAFT_326718 [Filobasidium floriforme]KAG7527302.1 hypothetical protein FFLO_07069 [Filobasidium floriforme]KAH8079015.1 hypothetical protein HD553DRAFT_326718 [Filobasidium floriforme]